MNPMDLNDLLDAQPSYRTAQVTHAIFHDLIEDWEEATTLPKDLRVRLSRDLPLAIEYELLSSKDGRTLKALIRCADGSQVETVLMRHTSEKGAVRNTVCLSSQVGCALGCKFCATGAMGFGRNLSEWEIVQQVLLFARLLNTEGAKVTNVVFMGMGEPFLNYDAVLGAIRFMNDPVNFGLGARRFSISTAGVIPGIERLAGEELDINLAISLHAPTDELRQSLMPLNKRYPLGDLLRACKDYFSKKRRKLMFEYTMIAGVNDAPEHAERLARMLRGMSCVVNLIPYNATGGYSASSAATVRDFKDRLAEHGLEAIQRYSHGLDIGGACGQLAGGARPKQQRPT